MFRLLFSLWPAFLLPLLFARELSLSQARIVLLQQQQESQALISLPHQNCDQTLARDVTQITAGLRVKYQGLLLLLLLSRVARGHQGT